MSTKLIGITENKITSIKKSITIQAKHLKTSQKIHAFGISVIPLIGLFFAIGMGFKYGITIFEISILLGMFGLTFTGITVGYHRYLTHQSFKTSPTLKVILTIWGSMAAQGPALYWVSNHRRHHQFSDASEDPHSPYYKGQKKLDKWKGLFHAHTGWMFTHDLSNPLYYSHDLLKDALFCKVNKAYYLWVIIGLIIPTLIGYIVIGNYMGALSGFLWGGLVRLFFSYHMASCINSVTHMFGRIDFKTSENSKNTAWLAIPTMGESWHNNHHAFLNSAQFGLKWWQIDLGFYIISILEALHLVWNVRRPSKENIRRKLLNIGQRQSSIK